jgi:hypothetical protein
MRFGDILDNAIAPFAPDWAARRISARARMEAATIGRDGVRQYDAAGHDRRTSGWNRSASSADRENASSAADLGLGRARPGQE